MPCHSHFIQKWHEHHWSPDFFFRYFIFLPSELQQTSGYLLSLMLSLATLLITPISSLKSLSSIIFPFFFLSHSFSLFYASHFICTNHLSSLSKLLLPALYFLGFLSNVSFSFLGLYFDFFFSS